LLRRWVSRGLITQTQADAIAASEGWPSQPPPAVRARRISVTAEALGYLGAVLVVVAASLISARYWDQFPAAGRLALPAASAALMLGAGLAVGTRHGPVVERVRSVLWLSSVVALAFAAWVLGNDVLSWRTIEDVLVLVGLATAGYAAVLWARSRQFLQLGGLFVALALAAGSAAAHLDGGDGSPIGLALWGTGAGWLALAWGRMLPPRRGALVLGAAGVVVGSMSTLSVDWGYVLAVVSVAGLIGLGVLLADVLVLAVSAIGALLVLPATIMRFFPGELAAPLALLLTGVLLIAGALRTVRRHGVQPPQRLARFATGSRVLAIGIAGVLALGALTAALAVGLSG
jgi:hypothetical protein